MWTVKHIVTSHLADMAIDESFANIWTAARAARRWVREGHETFVYHNASLTRIDCAGLSAEAILWRMKNVRQLKDLPEVEDL